jgi:hypothetical protein
MEKDKINICCINSKLSENELDKAKKALELVFDDIFNEEEDHGVL